MSIYGIVLTGVEAVVSALPGFLADVPGVSSPPQIVLREDFEFIPNQDRLPAVIIAPAEGLAEQVLELLFDSHAVFGYQVNIALVHERRFDAALRDWKLDRRQELADKLFDSLLLEGLLPGSWDVDYEPNPGGLRGIDEKLRATTQRFTFKVSRPRFVAS